MTDGFVPVGPAVTEMLAFLDAFVPAAAPPLPDPTVSVTSLAERSVGLGNLSGLEFRGDFQVAELKGVRLDALVRYDLWGRSPGAATRAATDVGSGLLGSTDVRRRRVLKLNLERVEPPEFASPLDAWRVAALFRVLYEFPFQDDDAESLIARIPLDFEPESPLTGTLQESVVTDDMTRWDDAAAPALVVRGPFGLGTLLALSWFSGLAPAAAVTLTRTFDAAAGAPAPFATLDAFLAAVSGPAPVRHARVVFPNLTGFLTALGTPGVATGLADRAFPGVLDLYVPRSRPALPPLVLATGADRLEIAYGAAALERPAVIYLRAMRA